MKKTKFRQPEIRKTLSNEMAKYKGPFAIFLSAGADSNAVLFSLLDLGHKPTVYNITMEGHESKDYLSAKATAQLYGLKFVHVQIPRDLKRTKKDLLDTIHKMNARGKVTIEALWAYKYAIDKVKEPYIVSGLAAGMYFVLSKKGCIHFKDRCDEYRAMGWKKTQRPDYQHALLDNYCKKKGKRWLSPWITKEMMAEFKGLTWDQMNRPKQKQVLRNQYKEDFDTINVRSQMNMHQGDSGMQAHLALLLKDPVWNRWGFKSTIGIYNKIIAGEITYEDI